MTPPFQEMQQQAPTQASAIRGHIISLAGDPFVIGSDAALVSHPDGVVVTQNGIITAVGAYAELRDQLTGVDVDHFPGQIISAGFVDTHAHYTQTGIIASYGSQLIEWLENYTFPEEQRFQDPEYAAAAASLYFDQLLSNGTTTALAFCATYPASVDAFFAEATRRNMRMAGGKVLMDRHAPKALLDTAQSAYDDSLALIDRWHGVGRNHYAVTPRFAPTSTQEQLKAAAALLDARPGTLMHTHVCENHDEISWVRELFPHSEGYLDVYDRAGLLRPGAVLAHGVHLTENELARVHFTGSAIAHCPSSNNFLGSGLFDLHAAKHADRPVTVGLGTDIGAGTSFSLLTTMGEAYKVAHLGGHPLDAVKLFYLATLGGAETLGLAGHIGSISPGKDADLVVLDPAATPLLAHRTARAETPEDVLFALALMGDDRAVTATYVAGAKAYEREPATAR